MTYLIKVVRLVLVWYSLPRGFFLDKCITRQFKKTTMAAGTSLKRRIKKQNDGFILGKFLYHSLQNNNVMMIKFCFVTLTSANFLNFCFEFNAVFHIQLLKGTKTRRKNIN